METKEIENKGQKMFILAGVLLAIFLASMDSTIVGTAMPQVIRSLNGMEHYTWPFTIYILCTAVVMPIVGKLADTFGFKLLYFIGIGLFLGGSALCGTSWSMMQLILFRGIQGIGAGILSANTLGIIGVTFSPVERAKYMGLGSSVYAFACIVGPSLGGFITVNFSWRWIFYINIPLGIIAMAFIFLKMPNVKNGIEKKDIDYFGIMVFVLAVVPLLLALTWAGRDYEWFSVQIIGMFTFSAVMLILFAIIEKNSTQPIIPLGLFKNVVFSVCSFTMLLINGIVIGVVIFVPLFVQGILGANAVNSGAILTPLMFSLVIASILCGRIISKTKKYKRLSVIGVFTILPGVILLSTLTPDSKNSVITLIMILIGIGFGFAMPVLNIAVQNAFSKEQVGMVTSVLQFFRLLGTTVFSAVFGTILTTSMNVGIHNMSSPTMPDSIEAFLKNPQSLTNIAGIAEIKSKLSGKMLELFDNLLQQLRLALSHTINNIFILCSIIAIAALILVLLLKELPLRGDIEEKKYDSK